MLRLRAGLSPAVSRNKDLNGSDGGEGPFSRLFIQTRPNSPFLEAAAASFLGTQERCEQIR